ncbi:MAG TPA: Ldh family oxidoreductase [Ornithinicoccus sp.]|nr:Ldh family oxidoreductase [Ornithinicoccus sp.]
MSERVAYRRGTSTGAPPRRVALDELRSHCAAVLQGAGLPSSAAALVAESLVDAEARGISSHGVNRTRIYSERLRAGLLDAEAQPEVVKERPGGVLVDAHNAIGHVGAMAGMDLAVERTSSTAAVAVGVRNSNHCGTLGYFTRSAARRGVVAIAMSTAPRTMVYYGGRTRAVGTNPLSIAVPRPDGPPVVVDMATSATARGKIILANQLGKDIPEGWAVDVEGRPTTDAAAALEGSVVPFAGPKGSGLAMMVELLAGAMVAGVTGAGIGDMYEDWTRPQRVAHLFLVLDPDAWLGRQAFLEHVREFAATVHALPPAEGFDGVRLPGDVEEEALALAVDQGVLLAENVFADLNAVAEEMGVNRRLTALGT